MDDHSAAQHPETGPSLVFEEKATKHSVAEDILGLLTGTFLVSFGLYLLQLAGAVTGGTAGLALLIELASGWPFWAIFGLVNLPFVILAIRKRGWDFTLRTALCIGLVSAFTEVHSLAWQIAELNAIYGTLAGNLITGVGLLILFRHRASLGGVNIVALIVQDRTGFRAGWTMMIFDTMIVLSSLLVLPWPGVLLSAAGAVLLNLVLAMNHRPGRYIGR